VLEERPAAVLEEGTHLVDAVDVALAGHEQEFARHQRRQRRVGVGGVGPEVHEQQGRVVGRRVARAPQELRVSLGPEQMHDIREQEHVVTGGQGLGEHVRPHQPSARLARQPPGRDLGDRRKLDERGIELLMTGERGREERSRPASDVEQPPSTRRDDPSDGRGARSALTAKGLRKLRDAQVTHHGVARSLYLERLTERDQRTLARLLEKALPGVVTAEVWPPGVSR
jgi:hypothetical protein